jgi:hypothetical protein
MHTTQLPSGNLAHHNGDFSGEVQFVIDTKGYSDEHLDELKAETDKIYVWIPFDDLVHLVASWKRDRIVAEVEQADSEQIMMDW